MEKDFFVHISNKIMSCQFDEISTKKGDNEHDRISKSCKSL